jgi:branched-chain amino acid aminotransferase
MSKYPIYYVNGKYVPANRATIPIQDLGLARSFALFDSLRTYRLKPFLLKPHLDRLFNGGKKVGIRSPLTQKEFGTIIQNLIKKNGKQDVLIRMYLTGGPTKSILPAGNPSVIILTDPLHPFPEWQYEKGIKLMTTPTFRIHPDIKSTVYFSAVFESARASRTGFTEVAYVDSKGAILEGSTFNVAAILPGPKLVAAKDGVLAGVTIRCVLDCAKKLKIPIQRSPITPQMMRRAKEMFITSSNRELIPVRQVDRRKIGNGKPGPVTAALHREYQLLTRDF